MSTFVYVTASADNKIIIFHQDQKSGTLEKLYEVTSVGGPAPLTTNPDHRFLYVGRRTANMLSSYHIDQETGGLSLIGETPLESDPNFLATDRTGQWLLSSYYKAGRCAIHPIKQNGSVSENPVEWRLTGIGAHSIQTDRSNQFAFVPHISKDNGPNTIFQFVFDQNTGRLTPNDPATVPQDAELGPRHYCFHPFLNVLYFSNEQGSSVSAYNINPSTGTLSFFQQISTIPPSWNGENSCSQIQINSEGTMLFAPNRGHDSIACYLIDHTTGKMTCEVIVPTEPTPRALSLDPSGKYLYVAGLDSGTLAAYRVTEDPVGLNHIESYAVGEKPMWVLPL